MSRLNSGNTVYHQVQNFFSSRLLSMHVIVKLYRTIIIAFCSKWLQILVSHIKGGTLTEGVIEQGAEENIWT